MVCLSEGCYSQPKIDMLYFNHEILATPLVCEYVSKRVVPNDNAIDSIVTRGSMELMAESPFTFIYLRSGKQIEIIGECIYFHQKAKQPFCVVEPPCCDGNMIYYHWMQYIPCRDTVEQMCDVVIYTPTDIKNQDIIWHTSPKKLKVQHLQLRSTPIVNDTEKDYELRQIGNVIYTDTLKYTYCYELGYNKKQHKWKICAVRYGNYNYLIGWMKDKS